MDLHNLRTFTKISGLFPVFPVIPEISYLFALSISVKFPHNFCVSEVRFISVRFPTVGIPLRSISAEHRIPEISELRIALVGVRISWNIS